VTTPGQIQSPSLWAKVTRNLGIKQRSVAPDLGPTIHPVVVLEDHSVKNIYDVTTERPSGAGVTVGAVAAQFAFLGIFNPLNTGIVARVDFIAANGTGELFISLEDSQLAAGTGQPSWWRDRRLALSAADRGAIFSVEAGNQVGAANRPVARLATPFFVTGPAIILRPGSGCYVFATVVNTALTGTFWWTEINEKP